MRPLTLLVLPAVAAVALSACSGSGQADNGSSPATIRLGISPFQDTMLPLVAEQKGWFKAEGISVELKSLAWDAIMPAVASGSVDAAINNTTGVVSVASKSPNILYWYAWNPFTQGSALMGRKSAGLQTLVQLKAAGLSPEAARVKAFEQLKGKTIVTTMSTDMGKQVVAALKSVNLTQEDVKIVDMNPDQGLAAFLSGTGDAYLGGIPQRTRATAEGMLVVASGPDLAPPPINGLVTTTDYAGKHDDSLLKLVHVLHKTIRYCDANTADCGKIITEQLNKDTGANLTIQGFVDFWQKFELYAGNAKAVEDMILAPTGVAYWEKTWNGDNEYLASNGSIPSPVEAKVHFKVKETLDAYVKRYGENESGF